MSRIGSSSHVRPTKPPGPTNFLHPQIGGRELVEGWGAGPDRSVAPPDDRHDRLRSDAARDCLSFCFSSRRRHTRLQGDWSSEVCSSDLALCVLSLRNAEDAESAENINTPRTFTA